MRGEVKNFVIHLTISNGRINSLLDNLFAS
jgi:hypothetical protein